MKSSDVKIRRAGPNDFAKVAGTNEFELAGRGLLWTPVPGVSVPHVGYRRHRSASDE